jgi:hypothetical protein
VIFSFRHQVLQFDLESICVLLVVLKSLQINQFIQSVPQTHQEVFPVEIKGFHGGKLKHVPWISRKPFESATCVLSLFS